MLMDTIATISMTCTSAEGLNRSSDKVTKEHVWWLCETHQHTEEMEDMSVAGFHRRWSKRHRINTELRRWLHLMDAVVAKLRGTRDASWSARCITRRWRQWARRRVALEIRIGTDRSNLICFHTVAIERVQESVAHDISALCYMFARLLRGEVGYNKFYHAVEGYFSTTSSTLEYVAELSRSAHPLEGRSIAEFGSRPSSSKASNGVSLTRCECVQDS